MKDIPGYEGLYAVTEDGRVWSYPKTRLGGRHGNAKFHHDGKWLSPRRGKSQKSYYSVSLCKDGVVKAHYIHRLVAEMFIPNPKKLQQVNHIDADRFNNHVSNLEWCTSSSNHLHARDMGLYNPRYGENHFFHKLTKEQVKEVRLKHKTGKKHREIAEEYGVSTTTITNIINLKARVYG